MTKSKSNDGVQLETLGTDAAKWSEAFAKRIGQLGNDALDPSPGGNLFAWVANMIEAGRSAGYTEHDRASGREEIGNLAITSGMHGIDVSKVALDIAGANSGQELANVIGEALDEAFNAGALHASRVNTYSKDGFELLIAEQVEFKATDGKVWINVDGKLTVRIGHVGVIVVDHIITTPKLRNEGLAELDAALTDIETQTLAKIEPLTFEDGWTLETFVAHGGAVKPA